MAPRTSKTAAAKKTTAAKPAAAPVEPDVTTTPEPVEPTEVRVAGEEPSLTKQLEYLAIVEQIEKDAKAVAVAMRARITPRMVEDFVEEGSKSRIVRVGGAKVGTATLVEPKDTAVVGDELALQEWMEENIPESTQVVVSIRPNVLKALLDKGVDFNTGEDGETVVVWKKTGEVIPGLKFKAGGSPTRFSISGRDEDAIREAAATFDLLGAHDAETRPALPAPAAAETVVGEVIDGEVA